MARIGFGAEGLGWKGHGTLKRTAAIEDTGNAPLPGSVFAPRQVRLLKIAVIVMGVLLVGGFAFVLAAIVYQASHLKQAGVEQGTSPDPAPAPGFDLPVGADATLAAMSLDGDRLALHITSAAGPEIVVIDLASGKVVARVRLKSH